MGYHTSRPLRVNSLPVELVLQIANFMEPLDLCALRRTCRAIYQISLHRFAKTVLHTLKVDLTRHWLERVREVANNDLFCPNVRKLVIVGNLRSYLPQGPDLIYPVDLSTLVQDIEIEEWATVIQSMPLCRSFELRRPSKLGQINQYGWPFPQPIIHRAQVTCSFYSRILEVLSAEQIPMESFSMDISEDWLTEERDGSPLIGCTVAVPRVPDFVHLKELRLRSAPWSHWSTVGRMIDMIRSAKALTKLEVNCSWPQDDPWWFLSVLMSVDCLAELQDVTFSDMALYSPRILAEFLRSHRETIRSLTLYRVDLGPGGWKSLLHELASEMFRLGSLTLCCVEEDGICMSFENVQGYPEIGDPLNRRVRLPVSISPSRPNCFFDYSGPKMIQILQKVAVGIRQSQSDSAVFEW